MPLSCHPRLAYPSAGGILLVLLSLFLPQGTSPAQAAACTGLEVEDERCASFLPPKDIPFSDTESSWLLAQASPAAEQTLRMDRLEAQMRELNGKVDELTFQLRQLEELLRLMRQQAGNPTDQSFTGAAPAHEEGTLSSAPDQSPLTLPSIEAPEPLDRGLVVTEEQQSPGEAPRALGTLPGVAAPSAAAPASGPLDLSAIASGAEDYRAAPDPVPPAPIGNLGASALPAPQTKVETHPLLSPTIDPRRAYDQAYRAIAAGDYSTAETGFRQFIQKHPSSDLLGAAYFWLGESLLAQGDFRGAADAFLSTYRDYPESDKAPESLLKLGLSLEGLEEHEAACTTYRELERKFPDASPALLSRVASQKEDAGC